MWQKLWLGLLIFTGVASTHAALDFTPVTHDYVAEGISYREVNFHDDRGTVRLELPSGWSCRGAADHLELVPAKADFADGLVQAADLPTPQPLDETATAAFVQMALTGAPSGSQNAAVVEQARNGFVFNGADTFGVVISYQALGQSFRRSCTLLNLPQRRVLLRFTAPEKQFEALNKAFLAAIRSWELK